MGWFFSSPAWHRLRAQSERRTDGQIDRLIIGWVVWWVAFVDQSTFGQVWHVAYLIISLFVCLFNLDGKSNKEEQMASQRNTVSSGGPKSTGEKNEGKRKNPASFGRRTRTDLLYCLPARRVARAPAVEEDNKTRDPRSPRTITALLSSIIKFLGPVWLMAEWNGGQFIRGVCSEAEKNEGQWSICHLLYATTDAFKKLLSLKLGAK